MGDIAVKVLILKVLCFFLLSGVALAQEATSLFFGQHRHAKSYASMEVLKAAYAKLGIQAYGKEEPEGRTLVGSTEGILDGEVHRVAGVEVDFPELIRIPIPINKHEGVAYACRTDLAVDGWESLNELRVGRLIGIVFSEKGLMNATNVHASASINRLFDLLVAGRLDVVVYVRDGLVPQQKRLQDERLHIIEPSLVVEPLYHYLHEKHKSLAPHITRVLQQMQDKGEIKTIRERAVAEYLTRYPVK